VLVGFVVSKSVGNSVVRHRVVRQLRHAMRERLGQFSPGDLVAVRALPAAAGATYGELGSDLDRAIARAQRCAWRSKGVESGTIAKRGDR
jgi:ribonuclease P protein component